MRGTDKLWPQGPGAEGEEEGVAGRVGGARGHGLLDCIKYSECL